MPAQRFHSIAVAGLLAAVIACDGHAQDPASASVSPAAAASHRFPQPVRVGDLLGRRVLQPVESQPTLGWVRDLVKQTDGSTAVVIDYGGLLGLFRVGTRPIAVPLEAMVLLGQYMEVADLTPEQLGKLARYDGAGVPLPADSVVRVGLARPSH